MPTVVELERLRALIERLVPLASVQRGDVIRADNWNLVVDSLIEMARALTALQTEQDVPSHEHISEVSLDWLDAELRQLVERGPLGDPVATTRVLKMEQRASELSESLASVGSRLNGLRERLDETITRDIVRENSMIKVTQKVEGMADGREDVLALRRTLGTIRTDLTSLMELRENLEVDGRPVSMKVIAGRIADLELMRERLRLANGQVLDGRVFEQMLQQTQNTYVSRDDLEEILKGRRAELSEEDFDRIEGGIRLQLNADLEKMAKQIDEDVRTQFNARFADVEKVVAGIVADNIPTLRQSLTETLRTDLLATLESRTKIIQTEFENKLLQLRSDLERDFAVVRDDLTLIRSEVPQLREQIDTVSATTDAIAADFEKRLAVERAEIESAVDTRITSEIAASDKRTQSTITQSQKESSQLTREQLLKEINSELRSMELSLDQRIQDGVKKTVGSQVNALVDTAVGNRMAEVEKGLRAAVNDEVKRALGDGGGGRLVQPPPGEGSDFTQIPGIGTTFSDRLKSSGVQTYADLAAMKPADLARLLGRPLAEAEGMIKEAKRLARLR